jgi:hypothetical protein
VNPQAQEFVVQRHRKHYVKDSRTLLSVLLLMNAMIVATVGFIIIFLYSQEPSSVFFSINNNSQIISPIPVDKLSISQGAINNWVNEAVQTCFNFNYANYKIIPDKLKDYMIDKSIASYTEFFDKDENLRELEKNKIIVSVLARSAPTVDETIIIEGHLAQTITMEVEIIYSNAQYSKRVRKKLAFLVLRVPEIEQPLGVIIYRFEINNPPRAN